MAEILQIGSLSPYHKIETEIEKDEETAKRNILFLLMVLIGLNGTELLEQQVKHSAGKVEALKAKFERKQQLIDELNNSLKEISDLYDELNESGKKLDNLTESERQEYFAKSTKLQNLVKEAQLDVKLQMKNAEVVMQEIIKTAKTEVEPLNILDALAEISSRLSSLFQTQFGNNINFRK